MKNTKEEVYKEKQKRYKKQKNRMLYIFIIFTITGYTFFFTSNLWMPKTYSGVTITPIGSEITANDRIITLSDWLYCEEEKKMRIIVEIENFSIEDKINNYEWTVSNINGRKKSEVIIDKPDFVVIEVSNISKRFSEFVLIMDVTDEDKENGVKFDQVKIYISDKEVRKVDELAPFTEQDYRTEAKNSKIDVYEKKIREEEEKIKEYENEIKTLNEDIQKLQSNLPSGESESSDLLGYISKYETKRDELEMNVTESENLIESYRQKLASLKK
ncbi:MAG: hypothetical protein KH297_04715 [Firmicutes bacterium]|nr:hypothetical protein [Bacillota bacterium]